MDEKIKEKELNDFKISELDFNSVDDITKLYLKEISRYRLLTKEEEEELLRKYKEENDEDSYQKLVNHNLRLSVFVAKRYSKMCNSMTLLDLIQENNLILMGAIRRFDNTKSDSLCSYIITAMRRRLIFEIDRKDSMIRKPVNVELNYVNYKKYIKQYYLTNHAYPTDIEIKRDLSLTDKAFEKIKKFHLFDSVSLNKNIDDDNNVELGSIIPDKEKYYLEYEKFIDNQILKKTLQSLLSKKDYYIIYNRIILNDNKFLDYLGKVLDVRHQAIQQKEKRILEKLGDSIIKEQQKIIKKYTISELTKMNLDPVSPEIQAIYYYMKNYLDDLTYYIMYTRKFNQEANSILHYQHKFPFVSMDSIKDAIKLSVELETKFDDEKFIFSILDIVKKKYTIDEIFELDIKPTINIRYQELEHFFKNYNFDDIKNTDYFGSLDRKQQLLIKKYFYIPYYEYQPIKKIDQIEKEINLSLIRNSNITRKEIQEYYTKNKNNMVEDSKQKLETYLNRSSKSNKDKVEIPIDIIYQELKNNNRLIFNIRNKTSSDMKTILASKKVELQEDTIESIKYYYKITERDLMSGKDRKKVLKLLSPIYNEKNLPKQKRK